VLCSTKSGIILPVYSKSNSSRILLFNTGSILPLKTAIKSTKALQEVASIIRVSRERAGLTQAELAELGHVSVRTIRDLESGRGNIGIRSLRQLAQVLGLTIDLKPTA